MKESNWIDTISSEFNISASIIFSLKYSTVDQISQETCIQIIVHIISRSLNAETRKFAKVGIVCAFAILFTWTISFMDLWTPTAVIHLQERIRTLPDLIAHPINVKHK